MKIDFLGIENFRNIKELEMSPCDGVNIIYGENGQGKTNLLEAMWLFTGSGRFRGTRDSELIRFNESFLRLELSFFDDIRERKASIEISEDSKKISAGGAEYDSFSKLFGEFSGILFIPDHLKLIKGGPSERRNFINSALCRLKPKYSEILYEYNRVLQQRNILLKDIQYHSELYETLDIWDEKLSLLSAVIVLQRLKYLRELRPFLNEIYEGLSKGREKTELSYLSCFSEPEEELLEAGREELKNKFLKRLSETRKEELFSGLSSCGPHRDDILIRLNGLPVKAYGSQGQQRSCALALRLSEAAVIKKLSGKQPVAFLDDVMSELDEERQDYILNHTDFSQVFISCCEPSGILGSESGKIYKIKEGRLCTCT